MRLGAAILIRLTLTLFILAAAVGYYVYLVSTKEPPRQRPATRTFPVVEVMELQPADYQVKLRSQGVVQPQVESQLTAEVSGKIVEISPSFLNGASFKQGDVLVKLDSRDFETELTRMQAALARAETAFSLAQAQTDKAREDWKKLGKGEPTDLALRIPQLNEAKADLLAAKADVAEAQLNVERCRISAPYDGRVTQKMVDVGQFVSPGTQLGSIFATDIFEVRLPLRDDQLTFLNTEGDEDPQALLTGESGPGEQWPAWIDRSEASVDQRTRQLFVIAAIDTNTPGAPPLPSGTFVEAQIEGEELENVFVVPRSAIRTGNTIMRITTESRVEFQQLDVIYNGADDVVIARADGAVRPGTRISITPLPFVKNGDQVTVEGEGGPPGGRPNGQRPPLAKGEGKEPKMTEGEPKT